MDKDDCQSCAGPHQGAQSPSRREFLYVGLIGGLGLTLGDFLTMRQARGAEWTPDQAAAAALAKDAKAKACIHIFLPGGMAAQESWDPKPLAPIEYRGPFGTVKTKLDGQYFGELMPHSASVADKITVIRSMTHGDAAHERGTHNMFTGYRPSAAVDYPSFGSVVSHELGVRETMPPYICVPSVPNPYAEGGYLGSTYGPFSLGSDPAQRGFAVRDLQLPSDITPQRFERRKNMLAAVDDHFRKLEKSSDLDAMNSFYQNAYALISSKHAREAFNLQAEPDALKDQYGRTEAGMRMLMSRRLVESGVRFVSMTFGGWDFHTKLADGFKRDMPTFDKAFAALINDLDQRKMLDSTLVMVSSEFGRTPKVNGNEGRDHYPKVFSVVLAGGGIKRGQVYGASDATSIEVAENPVTVPDLSMTIFHLLGIDGNKKLLSPGGRPIGIADDGKVLKGLLA